MRVGIVGCGMIGRRRAEVLSRSAGDEVVIVADVNLERAQALAREVACSATGEWREVAERRDVDAVIVSTTNEWLAPITIAALEHGKHVLCEKPLGREPLESRQMVEAARANRRTLKTGFNHRHHPGLARAHELYVDGAIGEGLFARCRYGHGGRPGYDREWRADRAISGGGELLDQGIHAVDLFRWFFGDFSEVVGFTPSYVWTAGDGGESGGGVEDNGFALFRTWSGQVASLHASWTQWKNLFSFEVFGRAGYLIVEGLGGSYGPEQLIYGRRRPESGPPEEVRFDFPASDVSWESEWREFAAAIREGRDVLANGEDGWQAVRMVHAVYESARSGQVVKLDATSEA